MDHISQEQAVDAARGLLGPGGRADVERHCAACPACAESLRVWQDFSAFVGDDEQYEPPAGVVRIARAQFASPNAADERRGFVARAVAPILAVLAFDTMDGLAAGVRSDGAASRHLLYEAPPFAIDLHLEGRRSERIALTGQIADTTRPASPVPATRVAVLRGMDAVCVVNANEFGEFACEFEPAPQLSLALDTVGLSLRILLDRLPVVKARVQ